MKKRKLLVWLSLGFLALGGIVFGTLHNSYHPVMADPESSEPAEPAFEEKVYTYEDEEGTSTLTLISETEFTMVMEKIGEEPINGAGTYTKDGNVLTLIVGDKELKVTIDNEKMTFAEYEEVFECKVSLSVLPHGSVEVDKKEGHIGEIVTVTVNPDLFYLVEFAEVNGSRLIEDENIRGVYKFALVEGDNKITVKFIIDEELLGKMSTMVEQASNKDWANLFSLKNVITLVSWLLSGGLLISMVKYYIKDKRLEKKVEDKIEKTVAEVVPEATKNIIVESLKELLAPYFAKIESGVIDIQEVCVVLCRCFALAQENTPEARIAITKELSSLKLSDKASISMIEEKIKEFIKSESDKMANVLAELSDIKSSNKEIVEDSKEPEAESIPEDDGTQI